MEPTQLPPAATGTAVVETATLPASTGAETSWEVLFGSPGQARGLLPDAPPQRPGEVAGVLIGRLIGADAGGEPLVDFPGNPCGRALSARSAVTWTAGDVGRDAVLLFEQGDPHRPLVLGFLQPPLPEKVAREKPPAEVEVDGERLVFTADREIVFRCGEASITLTRAGKVLIRGAYLLSRSSGVNRIKGGSVQIN